MKVVIENRKSRSFLAYVLRLFLFIVFYVFFLGSLGAVYIYAYYAKDVPDIPAFKDYSFHEISQIKAVNFFPMAEFYHEKRYIVPFSRIPKKMIDALTATEDAQFFKHSGISFKSILRAAIKNLLAGKIVEGGSTITQQLAKTFVGAKKSLKRKVIEAILARRIEDLYTKEQILTLYLNKIYYGHRSYGVQAASLNYFRKNVWELSLPEIAFLMGLPQSPSRYNPFKHPELARKRMEHVLKRMYDTGKITKKEYEEALNAKLKFYPVLDYFKEVNPYFTIMIKKFLDERIPNWKDKGMVVWTTLDPFIDQKGRSLLQEHLFRLQKRQGYKGALINIKSKKEKLLFFRLNEKYIQEFPDLVGVPVLAVVKSVKKRKVVFLIKPDMRGVLKLKNNRWAVPYVEFPEVSYIFYLENGKLKIKRRFKNREAVVSYYQARKKFGSKFLKKLKKKLASGKDKIIELKRRKVKLPISFEGKLKSFKKILQKGDVIVVRKTEKGGWELYDFPEPEGAYLTMNPDTGEVLSLQGGFDFDKSEVNRIFSVRQTGSLIKPVFYSFAYKSGLPPSAVFTDTPFKEKDYNPEKGKGKTSMIVWMGLAKSRNNISLRVFKYIENSGLIDELKRWAALFGLKLEGYISEILGSNQTLYNMVNPFCVFYENGKKCNKKFIYLVKDRFGKVYFDKRTFFNAFNNGLDVLMGFLNYTKEKREKLIPVEIAKIMVNNLEGVVKFGTSKRAKVLKTEVGGKTGTLPYDVWFAGFIPSYITGVWMGEDRFERYLGRNRSKSGLYASDTALPLFIDISKNLLKFRFKSKKFPVLPENLIYVRVDPETGLLDDNGILIPHLKGTQPKHRKDEYKIQSLDDIINDL